MLTVTAHKLITLDELAAEILPARVVAAINEASIELWRRHTMNDYHGHTLPRSTPVPTQRLLPVVVLGEMVIMPVPTPDPIMLFINEGKSYWAMQEAMRTDGEVLLVFVREAEIAGFRSDVPQPLPTIGVIARVREVHELRGAHHYITVEGISRADIMARIEHAPFYRAVCLPHPDPNVSDPETKELQQQIKTWVEGFAKQSIRMPEEASHIIALVNSIGEPGRLADICAYGPKFSFEERLTLLQTLDPVERLRTVQRKLGAGYERIE